MTKILSPFEAPIRKLNWGRHRINEFAWNIRQYETSNPVKLKQTETQIIIERDKSPPDEMPLILGDAIHNFRTALDLLASDLVRLNGKSTKNVYFPFALNANELEIQIVKKNFNRVTPAAIQLLREIGPHYDDNKYLRGLHDLDIMDKHLLILPVLQGFQMNKFRLNGPNGELVADICGPGDGISVDASPGDTATWESITYFFVFADGAPKVFAGKPIVETLESIAQLVGSIIELFRAKSAK